ncbi:molybdopterin-dependent oxidoreductase [Candidatus Poriferisodalis sp.]|uniref:molybdopterin-dependent oxidoreductase n=1 Tax=Candidatus Poriferisodalis sp. TaxID=3101277 RepID=UPI003B5CFAB3
MSDGSSQTPDADTPETGTAASAASNGGAVRRLVGRPGAGAGLLAGIAGAAVALAFGELIDGLVDTIPSLVVAVGEALVDYSPDWAVKLSIELFGEKDKAVLAIGIVGVSLFIGGLLGACAMASRRRWVPFAGFAAFAVIGGWTAARNPMSPFVGSWIVAVIAAALGYLTLRMLLRLAPAHSPPHSDDQPPLESAAGEAPDPAPDASRRAFLLGVGGAGVAAVGLVALGRGVRGPSAAETARANINLNPSAPPTTAAAAGAATAAETTATTAARRAAAAEVAALDTLDEVAGISRYLTPNDDFYRIDTALTVPQVDPANWKLRFTGMVDNPYELTFDEILAMDLQEHVITLSCVSNRVGGRLVGNAIWTGVPLVDLLDRAGVQDGADQVVGRSVDDWTAGFPTGILRDGRNAVLAVGMNGEPLPTSHGFPARLVVAGLYGYVSAVKWIEEIHLTTWDGFDGYWVPRGWSKRGPMKTQSRIDVPGNGDRPVAGTPTAIAGIAWAPTRGISAVEVRIDDGPWQQCELGEALGDESWVQWHLAWTPTAGTHSLQVRAIDGTGMTQPEGPKDVRPDGAEGWHRVAARVDAA